MGMVQSVLRAVRESGVEIVQYLRQGFHWSNVRPFGTLVLTYGRVL